MYMILLVDDDPTVRELVRRMLERRGYTVVMACNGADAVELLRQGLRPRLMILDLIMPVMDGNDVIEKVQEMGDDTPILIMSAYLGEMKEELARRVRGMVDKPPSSKKLLEAVQQNGRPDRPVPSYPAGYAEEI